MGVIAAGAVFNMRTAARIFNIIGFKHAAKLEHGCGIGVLQF